jgi:acyl-CoA reductase-like NAD-dependent aldehyde dehydrogenase
VLKPAEQTPLTAIRLAGLPAEAGVPDGVVNVVTNIRPEMAIGREEIFGPVVVAAPFQSLDDIAAAANDSGYGLGAGIWTKDVSEAHAAPDAGSPARSGTSAETVRAGEPGHRTRDPASQHGDAYPETNIFP